MTSRTQTNAARETVAGPAPVPTVVLKDVSFSFGGTHIFDSLDITLPGGTWTCLLGPSGAGKSTLLRLISGSLTPHAGTITFDDRPRKKRTVAWMAQKDMLLPWLTVEENVWLGARLRGEVTADLRDRARGLIDAAGLAGYEKRLPAALSGGMCQRVALLRTLMEDRPVILMDEPFSALDALTRMKLQDLAADLVGRATVLLVTHDPLEALRLGHHIHVLTGPPAVVVPARVPASSPPRRPADPTVLELHASLLSRLMGDAA